MGIRQRRTAGPHVLRYKMIVDKYDLYIPAIRLIRDYFAERTGRLGSVLGAAYCSFTGTRCTWDCWSARQRDAIGWVRTMHDPEISTQAGACDTARAKAVTAEGQL